jgi:hypothetical protein
VKGELAASINDTETLDSEKRNWSGVGNIAAVLSYSLFEEHLGTIERLHQWTIVRTLAQHSPSPVRCFSELHHDAKLAKRLHGLSGSGDDGTTPASCRLLDRREKVP